MIVNGLRYFKDFFNYMQLAMFALYGVYFLRRFPYPYQVVIPQGDESVILKNELYGKKDKDGLPIMEGGLHITVIIF
jgi:hypothetical protein